MSNAAKRIGRVEELIQRKLASLVPQEIRDPRMPHFVTFSAVKVSGDLSHAKVYFTVLQGEPSEVAGILNAASGFLRAALARTLTLRIVPQLHFVYDESVEYGKRLGDLINSVNLPEDAVDDEAPASDS